MLLFFPGQGAAGIFCAGFCCLDSFFVDHGSKEFHINNTNLKCLPQINFVLAGLSARLPCSGHWLKDAVYTNATFGYKLWFKVYRLVSFVFVLR